MEANEDNKTSTQLVARLKDAIGHENVKTSKMERLLYSHDLAPLPKETQIAFKNVPDVVVRPRTVEDCVKIVRIAAEEGVPITPRGSSTWGLGGSIPIFGGILIDFMGGMNKIIDIDPVGLTVTAQPGCTWKQVYDACMEKGLLLCSYPSSFPSATLAGWISTGGIGVGSYKYGSAGQNLRNLKVVMPDGTLINTGFEKVSDTQSAYNLQWLIVGAEGTLGLIAEVTLKLMPGPEIMKPLSYSFDSLMGMSVPVMEMCRKRIDPLHISFSDGKHFELLRKVGKEDAPKIGAILNIMLEGDKVTVEHEEKVIEEIMIKAGAKRMDDHTAQHEWDERCYEFRAREMGIGHIPGEAVIPLKDFAVFAERTYKLMDDMKMVGAIIGIVADRNTVMFMPYYFADFDDMTNLTSFAFNKKFADMSYDYGGRPLGFGAFFASNLDKIRGPGAKYIRTIKSTLDPEDVMNPGKLVGTYMRNGMKISPAIFNIAMDAMAVAKLAFPRNKVVEEKVEIYSQERAVKERAEAVHQHPKDNGKH